jgi:nifR3 family TIM-barrel protein
MLAPMAGFTDDVMRSLCHRYGASLGFTEMVSAKGLLMSQASRSLLCSRYDCGAVAVQLFGHDENVMAQAAQLIEGEYGGIFSAIDINMGCPARKIVKSGEGSALLTDLPRARRIMEAVVKTCRLPVSVKIRIGDVKGHNVAVEVAKMALEEGISAITVHGRTRDMGYAGQADWNAVGEVKAAVGKRMVVIGNGDVKSAAQAQSRIKETGCDAVMIGRAAIGRPWVFSDRVPERAEQFAVIRRHLEKEAEKVGEALAVPAMRKTLAAYIHGMTGAARAREAIYRAETVGAVWEALNGIFSVIDREEAK